MGALGKREGLTDISRTFWDWRAAAMSFAPGIGPVVFTNKARCRDCYRCVRVCPVKAIRMHEGQANVVRQLCISCGTCVRECPQGAKSYRRDLDRARELLASGGRVAASVAPSFVAVFPPSQQRRLPSALRRLGFSYVGETAIGAYHVAAATAQLVQQRPEQTYIGTACPALVRFVEQYRPQRIGNLVPLVSPMLAHARHIRRLLAGGGEVRVVFIGPCVAKKAEADQPENEGIVDCVLTFDELAEWFAQEKIALAVARRAISTKAREAPPDCSRWKAAAPALPAGRPTSWPGRSLPPADMRRSASCWTASLPAATAG